MADFVPSICGTNETYIPEKGCSDCDKLEERIKKLEDCCDDVKEELTKKLEVGDITAGDGIIVSIGEDGKPVISTSKEEILELLGYEEIELSKTDDEGQVVIAHVLGYITVEQLFTWLGLDPLEVNSGEEFDPMDGVSAIGCEDTEADIELLSPTIEGVGAWTVPKNGTIDLLNGITATDIDGEDATEYVKVFADNLDLSTAGTYTILYTATDPKGNHAEEETTITVLAEEQISTSFKVVANSDFSTEEITVYYVDEDGNLIETQDSEPYWSVVTIPSQGTEIESTFTSGYAVKKLPAGVGMYDCDGEFHTTDFTGTVDYDTGDCINAEVAISGYTITLTAVPDEDDEGGEDEPTEDENIESEGE